MTQSARLFKKGPISCRSPEDFRKQDTKDFRQMNDKDIKILGGYWVAPRIPTVTAKSKILPNIFWIMIFPSVRVAAKEWLSIL